MENLENEKNIFQTFFHFPDNGKKHERIMDNHGKIMEFDYRKPLGTLKVTT